MIVVKLFLIFLNFPDSLSVAHTPCVGFSQQARTRVFLAGVGVVAMVLNECFE
jgi:hypothetical protein